MNSITFIIPTIKFSSYLDEAIDSILNVKNATPRVIVNIGSNSVEFSKSKHWNSPFITWRYANSILRNTATGLVMTYSNINDGIDNSIGDWLFVLCDDDKIDSENFLKNVNLDNFGCFDLFMTSSNIIDEFGNLVFHTHTFEKNRYSNEEIFKLFWKNKLHMNLSLFIFSRRMYQAVNNFSLNYGYPNGYYGDTIFNVKAICNCSVVYTNSLVNVLRREWSSQQSAKFYFGSDVNYFFENISHALFQDSAFALKMEAKKIDTNKLQRKLIRDRVFIEWSKLNNPVFNVSFKRKLCFIGSYLKNWNLGISFKIFSLGVFTYSIMKGLVNDK